MATEFAYQEVYHDGYDGEGDDSAEIPNGDVQDTPPDSDSEIALQAREAGERLGSLSEIQPETWAQLDSSQRLEVLQTVEGTMAEIQGRPGVPVSAEDMPPGVFGGYADGKITLNSSYLDSGDSDVREMVDTIVHEGRHAYQDYAVENPGFDPNTEQVNAWAENLKPGNYLDAEHYGEELYQGQPVESDAWQYAGAVTAEIYEL